MGRVVCNNVEKAESTAAAAEVVANSSRQQRKQVFSGPEKGVLPNQQMCLWLCNRSGLGHVQYWDGLNLSSCATKRSRAWPIYASGVYKPFLAM